MSTMNELEALDFLRGEPVRGVGVRVEKRIAKKWLLENRSRICGGSVFFFEIKKVGLGVYKVVKAPNDVRETKLVK